MYNNFRLRNELKQLEHQIWYYVNMHSTNCEHKLEFTPIRYDLDCDTLVIGCSFCKFSNVL